MLNSVQSYFEKGDLKKAVKALRAIGNVEKLSPTEMLRYFQLSRRVGDFQYGAIQLEKLGTILPELEVEMAFFLGELGAVSQAIRLLTSHRAALSQELEIQKYLQLGNFYSIIHDYPKAIHAYTLMENHTFGYRPVLTLVARLNILGHRIYQGEEISSTLQELSEFEQGAVREFPLIWQGALYFLVLAHRKNENMNEAKKYLAKAFALGVEHRLRESLLLDLTRWELDPESLKKAEITTLKKKIEEQVHILYWDQFQKIMGRRYELEGNLKAANRMYQNVLFGNRLHGHRQECEYRWRELNAIYEPISGWSIERRLAMPMSQNKIIYNKFERRQWPIFSKQQKDFIIENEPGLNKKLCGYLIRNLEFPIRDAEVWENIWDSQFSFISSSTVIRTSLSRWRKSKLSTCAQLIQKNRRLYLKLEPEVCFFTP